MAIGIKELDLSAQVIPYESKKGDSHFDLRLDSNSMPAGHFLETQATLSIRVQSKYPLLTPSISNVLDSQLGNWARVIIMMR
jgi:hypothetical protein